MVKVKLTVIKKYSPKDILGEEFIRPDGRPISICWLDVGREFIVDETGHMPEDFCHHAWYGLYKNVNILRCGGGFEGWTGEDMIYSACPDGIRPVIFKVERIKD